MAGGRAKTVGLAASDFSSLSPQETPRAALGSSLKPELFMGAEEFFVEADVPGRVRRPHGGEDTTVPQLLAPQCVRSVCLLRGLARLVLTGFSGEEWFSFHHQNKKQAREE